MQDWLDEVNEAARREDRRLVACKLVVMIAIASDFMSR